MGKREWIANSRSELASELCYTILDNKNYSVSFQTTTASYNLTCISINLPPDTASYLQMLETALSCLLEARHVSELLNSGSSANGTVNACTKFWIQLQTILKKMLASSLSADSNKTNVCSSLGTSSSKKCGDAEKLRELYRISLKSPDFNQLHYMNNLWVGITAQEHRTEATQRSDWSYKIKCVMLWKCWFCLCYTCIDVQMSDLVSLILQPIFYETISLWNGSKTRIS